MSKTSKTKTIIKLTNGIEDSDNNPNFKVLKYCKKCPADSNLKLLSDFHLINKGKLYSSNCKECNNKACRFIQSK